MPLDFPKRPNVPIIGQTYGVITWYPTALIQCQCGKENHSYVIVVTGMQNIAACGNCGKGYMIERLDEAGQVHVRQLVQTPPGRPQ